MIRSISPPATRQSQWKGLLPLIRQLQRSLSTEDPNATTADCPVSKEEGNAEVGGGEVRGRIGKAVVPRGMEIGIGTGAGVVLCVHESK
jgi:hypothetical protein